MTSGFCTSDPVTSVQMDLSDSLDVRLMLSGRLSPATMQLRRDRAELSAVLGRPGRSGVERPSDGHQEHGQR
jgi:hypothetical protein